MPADRHASTGRAPAARGSAVPHRPHHADEPPHSSRPRRSHERLDVLAVIAVGGVLGAEARYGVGLLLAHPPDAFPWSTLLVNALGCLLIGVLMVVLTETTAPHRLARPFLGVGVLGGFTTFSTYAVDVQRLLLAHRAGPALAYLAGTLAAALVAVWLGATTTRALVARARRTRSSRAERS
jgi:CrcB protein